MTSPAVCVGENLVIGEDGKLRLAPWSVPRNVVDVVAHSTADTTKLLETRTLPGRRLIDRKVQWINDSPVDHRVRIMVTRRWKRWVTSNPNAVQFRDRWSTAITPKGDPIVEPAEPITTDYLNGQVGAVTDIGTNSVAEPQPGKFWHWWGTGTSEEWIGPLVPGDTLRVWYRTYVWTPPPWSDNANKNAPAHEAEAGFSRIQLIAHPEPGPDGRLMSLKICTSEYMVSDHRGLASTQENSGTGMQLWGADSTIVGCVVSGLSSDSDNTQDVNSNHGLVLNNVANSVVEVAVTSEAPLNATPYAGVSLVSTTNNKIVASIDSTSVTWPVHGGTAGIRGNDIDLCRGITVSTPTGAFTPEVYKYREHQVTLTANRTVNNPVTPSGAAPVGLRFIFLIIQDATGGRILTWSSAYKIPSSATFDTTASTRTIIEFECVDTGNWVMTDFITGIPA